MFVNRVVRKATRRAIEDDRARRCAAKDERSIPQLACDARMEKARLRASALKVLSELIAARTRAALTQQQIANRMGTNQGAISRLESGTAAARRRSKTMRWWWGVEWKFACGNGPSRFHGGIDVQIRQPGALVGGGRKRPVTNDNLRP